MEVGPGQHGAPTLGAARGSAGVVVMA
jgi:hypothetical protein